jgi:DNA (cytosine-5)-methyltransferase 1
MEKIKLLSLFSGIGAFEKALDRLNIDYELVNYCEIDKFASKSYSLIHGVDESLNLWDITKVNEKELPDFDFMTYGFPCTSFSIAGLRKGFDDKRTGHLFFESLRIAKYKKPKYMIAENVKGLLSMDNGDCFEEILKCLDLAGYNNYCKVLNAKDYGIPQNRERVFIVSIRKDIDNLSFSFPDRIKLELKLRDLIENCKEIRAKKFKKFEYFKDYSPTLLARDYKEPNKVIMFTEARTEKAKEERKKNIKKGIDYSGRRDKELVLRKDELSNCITSGLTKEHLIKIQYSDYKQDVIIDSKSEYYSTLRANAGGKYRGVGLKDGENIRKLTTKETFRLMGFDDSDHEKLDSVSNTQKYKMAGNSIVVNVLEAIFKQLFLGDNKRKWLF